MNFDDVIDRKNTCSLKWDYNQEIFGRKDIIPLWVADMDFPAHHKITEAISERAAHGFFGYTRVSDRYNAVVADWTERRNGWVIKEQWLVHTPGVVTSINNAILALTEENDKVLIQTPVYHPFFSAVTETKRQLVTNPLFQKDGYYLIDFDDLEYKLKSGVKMMILCSPHNPVGRVWKREELLNIAELCTKHNVILVSDEIHSDIVYKENRHIPIASLTESILQNSITLISPTKTFNLAGLAASLAIIPNTELRLKFMKTLKRNGADMLNIFGLTAAETAYEQGEEWLTGLMGYLQNNLHFLEAYLKENIEFINMIKPEATYLGWLDCSQLPLKGNSLKEFFIQKAGVGLNDGRMFGTEGMNFQRINFACPRSILAEGLERIEAAVKKLVSAS